MRKVAESKIYNHEQLQVLLRRALDGEIAAVGAYTEALKCTVNTGLGNEWQECLEQTRGHRQILEQIFAELDMESTMAKAGETVCRYIGESLVRAMQMAREAGNEKAAERVAAECVAIAASKRQFNWTLLAEIAKQCEGMAAELLYNACESVEEDVEHHLSRAQRCCRALWLQSLGLPATVPPPSVFGDIGAEAAFGAVQASLAAEHTRSEPGLSDLR